MKIAESEIDNFRNQPKNFQQHEAIKILKKHKLHLVKMGDGLSPQSIARHVNSYWKFRDRATARTPVLKIA